MRATCILKAKIHPKATIHNEQEKERGGERKRKKAQEQKFSILD